MATNVDDKIKKLSPVQRKKVETRAAELIAEEMTLRELRHARKLTQVMIAKKRGPFATSNLKCETFEVDRRLGEGGSLLSSTSIGRELGHELLCVEMNRLGFPVRQQYKLVI